MATTYYLRSANSDLTGGADWDKQLTLATGTQTTLTTTIAGEAGETSYGFTNSGVPGLASWVTGNWTLGIHVQAATNKTNCTPYITRVSSVGAVVSGPHVCDAGDQAKDLNDYVGSTATFAWTSLSVSGSTDTDRLRVDFYVYNDNHSALDHTIYIEGADTYITAPWTAASSMGSIAMHGYRIRRN